MSLQLIKGESPEVWLEVDPKRFPGFECKVAYVQPSRLAHLTEKCTKTERVRGRIEKELDNERFARMLAPEMCKDWRGLKAEYVLEMVPLAKESEEQLREAGELPYSEDALVFLVENAYSRDFFDAILGLATDLSLMKEAEKKARLGNSAGS